jgi:hypothetical protein
VALLSPLADAGDQLDAETEMAALPLPLQYFDGRRTGDTALQFTLVKTLFQVTFFLFEKIKPKKNKGEYICL